MKFNRTERNNPEINTTALPDIIMMLLFFFMVTTVMQDSLVQNMELPVNANKEALAKEIPSIMNIVVTNNTDHLQLRVNGIESGIEDLPSTIAKEVLRMRSANKYPEKAMLYIEPGIKMSVVNSLKDQLQEHEILNVEYIHKST